MTVIVYFTMVTRGLFQRNKCSIGLDTYISNNTKTYPDAVYRVFLKSVITNNCADSQTANSIFASTRDSLNIQEG